MRKTVLNKNYSISEESLDDSPCGMLLLDRSGCILQLNPALETMLGHTTEQLLGQRLETLSFPALKGLFKGEGLVHLASPGVRRERWLDCKRSRSSGAAQAILFFQDVTEQVRLSEEVEQLRRQVEELTITDELTGLSNQRALNRALSTQVTRSRRYQNPLSLAVLELSEESDPAAELSDGDLLGASRYLRDRLRWVDVIARWDHNHFVIVLPETNARDGAELINKISREFTPQQLPQTVQNQSLTLRFGLAEWQKGDDPRLLMERAAKDLNGKSPSGASMAAT